LIRVRPTEPADLTGLAALFDDRFGHPLSVEDWEWKYRRLPGEARSWIALDRSGTPLAHAGALRLPARLGAPPTDRPGEPRDTDREAGIWQLTDWAGTTARGGLRPPLVELGRRLLDDLPRPGDAPWIFGFPSERHFRLGRRVFGYRPLPGIRPLAGPLAPAAAGAPERSPAEGPFRSAEHCGDWPDAAEAAWGACGVPSVRRSAAFLNWRYHARPGRYYRFYRLRAPLRALFRVNPGVGPGGAEGTDGLAVFAFVGRQAWAAELWLPPVDGAVEAWEPALRAVAADLVAAGLERWTAWPLPGPTGERTGVDGLLDRLGLRPTGDRVLMGCRGPEDPDPRFYYAMGDYDVV
jgi:hypothetical protein